MAEADRQLSKILAFVNQNKGYTLLVASSMGQAAVDRSAAVKTQLLIDDLSQFMTAIGVSRDLWQPRRAMVPMYMVSIDESVADLARHHLSQLAINDIPVEFIDLGNNIFQIFFQVENPDVANLTVTLNGETKSLSELGMGVTAIEDESGSYAYHIPEGILLVFDPERLAAKDCGTISTTQIAPAMLNNFQIAPPPYMVA